MRPDGCDMLGADASCGSVRDVHPSDNEYDLKIWVLVTAAITPCCKLQKLQQPALQGPDVPTDTILEEGL